MLGILLIYFIGRSYYKLAEEHGKSSWLFALVGIIVYYGGIFLGGILLALFLVHVIDYDIETINDYLLGFMALPFGLLACYGMYVVLKKQWLRKLADSDFEIIDSEQIS